MSSYRLENLGRRTSISPDRNGPLCFSLLLLEESEIQRFCLAYTPWLVFQTSRSGSVELGSRVEMRGKRRSVVRFARNGEGGWEMNGQGSGKGTTVSSLIRVLSV